MPRTLPALLATLALASAPAASALTIDFEEFPNHGDVVTASQGVAIIADSAVDIAVVFDTENESDTFDPDLERGTGWAFGNLGPDAVLDNILILQENDAGCGDGTCDSPDDDGSRPAGSFSFLFEERFQYFQFDLVDVDDASEEFGTITFLVSPQGEGGGGPVEVAGFSFDQFPGLGQGVVYGNNSANHIDLGFVGLFDTVVIEMGGSGGVDNLAATVPEPDSAALMVLGLLILGISSRRRH